MVSNRLIRWMIAGCGIAIATAMVPIAQAERGDGCLEYRLASRNGEGGIRLMSKHQDFRRVNNGRVTGTLCGRGREEIEIAKRQVDTRVRLSINGRDYVFKPGDRGDKLEDNWFREYVVVKFERHSGGGHSGDSDSGGGWGHGGHGNSSHSGHNDRCSQYRLAVAGGVGGVRFMSNQRDFHRANNRTIHGRICAEGRVRVQLSKRDRRTKVTLDIADERYVFRRGETGVDEDGWYRSYFTADLGGGGHGGNWNQGSNSSDSQASNQRCSEYRLISAGGDGGIRLMSNQEDFHMAHNGRADGKFCVRRGRQTIELSKRDPNTSVTARINGRRYKFGDGDKGDKLEHNWYRRYFEVNLHE